MAQIQNRRFSTRLVGCMAFFGALSGSFSSLHAHPHVWIEVRNAITFNDKQQIVSIEVNWRFDEICATCGHAHMPDPAQLEKATSLKTMAAIVFAVGVRPCTGAVLMLILAFTHGILAAGLIATFAMSLGTAVTVSLLATLTVGMKQGLLRLFSSHSRTVDLITKGLGVSAGIFIVIVGLTLLLATSPQPFI